jgi:hypothetical protein
MKNEPGDWRGETLARMRALIKEAVPDVVEERKWMGTPVWSHDGIICTGESYKNVVKLIFMKGKKWTGPPSKRSSSRRPPSTVQGLPEETHCPAGINNIFS